MTYGLLVLKCIRIYSMRGIFHACSYTSSIFWEEVSDVISSSTEVPDDAVLGGGRYFSVLEVERHLTTERDSCFFCIKGEMFDNSFPWSVEVADDIGQGRLCKQKTIWNKTKFRIVFTTLPMIETYQFMLTRKKKIGKLYFNNKWWGGRFLPFSNLSRLSWRLKNIN